MQPSIRARRMRIIRAVFSACIVCAMAVASFFVATQRTVALTINGETKTVKTYAMSVDRLLEQQGLTVSTHDIVTSTHNGAIENGDSVTYCQAFETTLSIDGASVPFWSCASSAQELLNFFSESEREAMSIKIDIANAYNQFTGGFTISGGGPVTVIADGKSTTIDGGNRTAASLLDACGIILGSNDRVSVEQDGDTTILRVQRVTYGTRTQDVTTPYSTQYITDASLAPGEQKVERAGTDGIVTQTLQVTYVDGVEESSSVTSETTKQLEVDEVIGVGPAQTQPEAPSSDSPGSSGSSGSSSSDSSNSSSAGNSSSSDDSSSSGAATSSSSASSSASASASASPSPSDSASQSPSPSASESDTPTPAESSTPAQTPTETPTPTQTPTETPTQTPTATQTPTQKPTQTPIQTPSDSNNTDSSNSSNTSDSGTVWHATVAEAKAYAKAAMAAYGWTSDEEWTALEQLWTRESNWLWYADNPSSDAYGIPQALPGNKMGTGWHDNAAVQIAWGLYYIRQTYGDPVNAWETWQKRGWY